MDRIIYGAQLAPSGIIEHVEFNKERPYSLSIKNFPIDEVGIPHYGKTYELLICNHLIGTLTISAEQYPLSHQSVYIIPPHVVHSVSIKKSTAGQLYVLKLPFWCLQEFINIENLLDLYGKTPEIQSISVAAYAGVWSCVQELIQNDWEPLFCFRAILMLLQYLLPCFCDKTKSVVSQTQETTPQMLSLIDWSEKHVSDCFSLEDAAQVVGYSKHYFCSWFKKHTAITYTTYLQQIRMNYACQLLLTGHSVTAACRLCGYENTSYFIRLFSKYKHCTPNEYRKLHSGSADSALG